MMLQQGTPEDFILAASPIHPRAFRGEGLVETDDIWDTECVEAVDVTGVFCSFK